MIEVVGMDIRGIVPQGMTGTHPFDAVRASAVENEPGQLTSTVL